MTKIVLDVLPRPYATTLKGYRQKLPVVRRQGRIHQHVQKAAYGPSKHDRMPEVFYTPYAAAPNLPFPISLDNFLVLSWDGCRWQSG